MTGCILFSLGYCITWWSGEVERYWLALTIIEAVTVFVNVYCLLAVIVQYRRIVSGVSDAKEPYYAAKGTRVYFDDDAYNVKPVLDTFSSSRTPSRSLLPLSSIKRLRLKRASSIGPTPLSQTTGSAPWSSLPITRSPASTPGPASRNPRPSFTKPRPYSTSSHSL